MKKISYVILTGLFLSTGIHSFPQCKLTSGDISVLKGQSEVNLRIRLFPDGHQENSRPKMLILIVKKLK